MVVVTVVVLLTLRGAIFRSSPTFLISSLKTGLLLLPAEPCGTRRLMGYILG
jgi:hypothetical protein